jgi:two-component system sensor histidine kinase/response regulator
VSPGQEEAWSAERLRRHRSNCTFNQQHADGTWLRIFEQSTPDGGVVGFRVDITQQQQLQRDLEQALVNANAAIRAKTHFLANISHEIRTPMNAILGMTYLAQIAQPDTKTGNYLDKISQASKQLLGIIDNILDASKIEAGKLELEAIPFSLEAARAGLSPT